MSIPAQLAAIRQYAIHQGWTVLEEFIEAGVSGRSTARPELTRLLARCASSELKVQAVIVHKLDRLARNLADHVAIRGLLSKQGVRLVSVTENLDDSVSGQLVEHIMASIAEFYSANLGEEVKKGMRQKVIQGGWPHKPPRGYRLSRDPWGRSRIEVDSKVAPVVTKAFELAVSGMHRGAALRVVLHRQPGWNAIEVQSNGLPRWIWRPDSAASTEWVCVSGGTDANPLLLESVR